ncbi:MAG: TIGR04372 family glycosyltransferase [Pseudobutyrivibrio sp.]|nr:TIGR04372 family glycosyltransferase [Pseudobutyrivibrio sp.]
MGRAAEALLDFCNKHKSIICYGAQSYGYTVKHFLEMHGLRPDCFLVSKKNLDTPNYVESVPLLSIDEVPADFGQCGFILSLSEKYHREVINLLQKKYGLSLDIFPIKSEIWTELYGDLLNKRREKILWQTPYNRQNVQAYEKRAQKIEKKYKYVWMKYADFGAMGSMGSWIAHCMFRKEAENKNIFILYYPYTSYEQTQSIDFKGANAYLLDKLVGEGIEVISENKLDFWRYFVQTRQSMVKNDYEVIKLEIALRSNYYSQYSKERQDKIYIELTDGEKLKGDEQLASMSIKKPYVCIASREYHYLPFGLGVESASVPDLYRNSDIRTRRKTIDYLRSCRRQTVRMGANANFQFNYEGCIDYASQHRTEFMDVYLAANCEFFLCDLNGIIGLPQLFSKPLVLTNVALLTTRQDSPPFLKPTRDLALPKKLWDENNKRFLTLREILKYEVESEKIQKNITGVFNVYLQNNIIAIDNSEDEILKITMEMMHRLSGIIKYDSLDEKLQQRYWAIVNDFSLGDNILSLWRIGKDFLRANQWWLN